MESEGAITARSKGKAWTLEELTSGPATLLEDCGGTTEELLPGTELELVGAEGGFMKFGM